MDSNEPTEEQKKEWEASRFHENDGTYRGDFGGPADAPTVGIEVVPPAAPEQAVLDKVRSIPSVRGATTSPPADKTIPGPSEAK